MAHRRQNTASYPPPLFVAELEAPRHNMASVPPPMLSPEGAPVFEMSAEPVAAQPQGNHAGAIRRRPVQASAAAAAADRPAGEDVVPQANPWPWYPAEADVRHGDEGSGRQTEDKGGEGTKEPEGLGLVQANPWPYHGPPLNDHTASSTGETHQTAGLDSLTSPILLADGHGEHNHAARPEDGSGHSGSSPLDASCTTLNGAGSAHGSSGKATHLPPPLRIARPSGSASPTAAQYQPYSPPLPDQEAHTPGAVSPPPPPPPIASSSHPTSPSFKKHPVTAMPFRPYRPPSPEQPAAAPAAQASYQETSSPTSGYFTQTPTTHQDERLSPQLPSSSSSPWLPPFPPHSPGRVSPRQNGSAATALTTHSPPPQQQQPPPSSYSPPPLVSPLAESLLSDQSMDARLSNPASPQPYSARPPPRGSPSGYASPASPMSPVGSGGFSSHSSPAPYAPPQPPRPAPSHSTTSPHLSPPPTSPPPPYPGAVPPRSGSVPTPDRQQSPYYPPPSAGTFPVSSQAGHHTANYGHYTPPSSSASRLQPPPALPPRPSSAHNHSAPAPPMTGFGSGPQNATAYPPPPKTNHTRPSYGAPPPTAPPRPGQGRMFGGSSAKKWLDKTNHALESRLVQKMELPPYRQGLPPPPGAGKRLPPAPPPPPPPPHPQGYSSHPAQRMGHPQPPPLPNSSRPPPNRPWTSGGPGPSGRR